MNIVRKIPQKGRKTQCQIYPCKNTDTYAIGYENRKRLNFLVCGNHLRQIIEEGTALLSAFGAPVPDEASTEITLDVPAQLPHGDEEESFDEDWPDGEVPEDEADDEENIDDTDETPSTEPTELQEGKPDGGQATPKSRGKAAKRRRK